MAALFFDPFSFRVIKPELLAYRGSDALRSLIFKGKNAMDIAGRPASGKSVLVADEADTFSGVRSRDIATAAGLYERKGDGAEARRVIDVPAEDVEDILPEASTNTVRTIRDGLRPTQTFTIPCTSDKMPAVPLTRMAPK